MSQYEHYFPLVDRVPGGVAAMLQLEGIQYRAKLLGEYRKPRAGEWYISGAIPEAYYARNDINREFQIAVIVKVKKIEYWKEVP